MIFTGKLNYPIEFYAQKRIALFLSIVGAFGFSIMFVEVFFDLLESHRGDLPWIINVIMMLLMGGMTLVFIKKMMNALPDIVVHADNIKLLNPLKSTYEEFQFTDINNIEFAFGKHSMLYIYLKNQPRLSNANKSYPIVYLKLDNQKLHSRQVADVIYQAFENYKNNNTEMINLRDVKKDFFDWD